MAHHNVQNHMDAVKAAAEGVPSDTFLEDRRRKFHNGDSIEMFYEPNAVTDADSLVHFRRADVIVAGDIFNTTQYPFIDIKNGGSVQGEIKALNDILNRTVYEHEEHGGTIVIPGHGYVSDEHEVVEYRDMMVIVRDRVQGDDQEGRHARTGEGRPPHRGLRYALREKLRPLDHGHVCRGRLHGLEEFREIRRFRTRTSSRTAALGPGR